MLIIILPAIVAQTIVVYVFYSRHWHSITYHTSYLIVEELQLLVDSFVTHDSHVANLANHFGFNYELKRSKSLEETKKYRYEELALFASILKSKIKYPVTISTQKFPNRVLCEFTIPDGILTVTFPMKPLVNPTVYIYVLWIIGANLVLLVVSLIFSRNQISSILDLAYAVDDYAKGKTFSYTPSGATEIRLAGAAVIRMQERIERQLEQRTKMLAMISHDLRTPLTRLRLQLELMDDQESELWKEMHADVANMEQMIGSYLDFARGEGREEFEEVELARFIRHQLSQHKYTNLQINFEKYPKRLHIHLRPQAMNRVFSNIINNASRFATQLIIRIIVTPINVLLECEDNGPGIPDNEKEFVLKAFYRADKARHIENKGNVGLGLAICHEIVQAHGGTISLHDGKKLGGLLLRITLPR